MLETNRIVLRYDTDNLPVLRCPVSGKIIFRPFEEGKEELLNYRRIKPILFSLLPSIDEADYFRSDLAKIIRKVRKSLGDESDDTSNLSILEEHDIDFPNNIMVIEIILDGLDSQFIGIDMGPEMAEEG